MYLFTSPALSRVYSDKSASSICMQVVYMALPVPPEMSLSWMLPYLLYGIQRSLSRISAARNRHIARSPCAGSLLCASTTAGAPVAISLAPNPPAPTASPVHNGAFRLVATWGESDLGAMIRLAACAECAPERHTRPTRSRHTSCIHIGCT